MDEEVVVVDVVVVEVGFIAVVITVKFAKAGPVAVIENGPVIC